MHSIENYLNMHNTYPLRTLLCMDSLTAETDTFENNVLHVFSALNRKQPREVDSSIISIMSVERDTRFYEDTLQALINQTVLPGTIVVADCANRVEKESVTSFNVQIEPTTLSGLISSADFVSNYGGDFSNNNQGYIQESYAKIKIIVIPIKSAKSFGDAVEKSLRKLLPLQGIKSLWLLHDDSKPCDNKCLEALRETWRNTPTACILGAKQVDWQGKILHNVGMYAWKHRVHSLTVEGEPDQEQYDFRGDVYSVSLAGALVSLSAWQTMRGTQPWLTTFEESNDFCRRVILSGGRVVVVPKARIAHRRARFDGIRTRSGEERPVEKSSICYGSAYSIMAKQRYLYTDIRVIMWPIVWLCSLPMSLIRALQSLFAKQPYVAFMHLILPWIALAQFPRAIFARRRVSRVAKVSLKRLSSLIASRSQITRWKDKTVAFKTQKKGVILSPLARRHLHKRILLRWSAAIFASLLVFAAVMLLYGAPISKIFSGSSLYSSQLLPTGSSFNQLFNSAIGSYIPDDGFASAIPPSPLLIIWMLASIVFGGNTIAAVSVIFFLAAPAMLLSFWALAGVFTRSDIVRVCSGICWTMIAMAFGIFARGDLPMLLTMVFLPAAFAFAFHAVGMYVTEDPVLPVPSIQCAACASLCFMIPLAACPQLILPMIVIFIASLIMVRSHRFMLALMPIPSVLVLLPTLGSVVRYFESGMWRQLFATMAVPSQKINGAPRVVNYLDVLLRAFNIDLNHFSSQSLPIMQLRGIIMIVFAVLALLMALASLALPFALRTSRMMWVVIVSGMALSLVASRVVIAADFDGPISSSVLPGVCLSALGVLACMCMVAGKAVHRFEPLRRSNINIDNNPDDYTTRVSKRAAIRRSAKAMLRKIIHLARGILAFGIFAVAILLGLFAITSGPLTSVYASDNGLPMVVSDYLRKNDSNRVLAIKAINSRELDISLMRTVRGDLIDLSPALQVRDVLYGYSPSRNTLYYAASKLLSHADDESIETLKQLGIGGIYIVNDSITKTNLSANNSILSSDSTSNKEATENLIANVNASDGTQLVVSSDHGTYCRFDVDNSKKSVSKTSIYSHSRPLSWRMPWFIVFALVLLLYCLVALPRFNNSNLIERLDD